MEKNKVVKDDLDINDKLTEISKKNPKQTKDEIIIDNDPKKSPATQEEYPGPRKK